MANALGVGLIGAGMIGQGHAYALRLLAEDGEVRPVAVTDFSSDAVDAARAICPFEHVARRRAVGHRRPRRRCSGRRHTHHDAPRPRARGGACRQAVAVREAARDNLRRRHGDVRHRHGVGPHRPGRVPFSLSSSDQRARTAERERRAGRADGLHAAGRPVLADRRRRARAQLVALTAHARGWWRAARTLHPQCRHPQLAVRSRDECLRTYAQRVRIRRRGHGGVHDRARHRCHRNADLDLQRRAWPRGTSPRSVLRAWRR